MAGKGVGLVLLLLVRQGGGGGGGVRLMRHVNAEPDEVLQTAITGMGRTGRAMKAMGRTGRAWSFFLSYWR